MSETSILFEPWALGDALIAASALALRPGRFVLVCQNRWHPIIIDAVPGVTASDLIGIEVSYEAKEGKSGIRCSIAPRSRELDGSPVYSIRGDIRDYYLARKVFGRSSVHMSGWIPFIARKLPFFDLPFRFGLLPVKNRYRMWMELLGLDYAELEAHYRAIAWKRRSGKVGIHVGAQWRSKQYPAVARLAELLRAKGKEIEILSAEKDPMPEGISRSDAVVAMGTALVERLRGLELVVTNDSGPMHLAAHLGVPTVALGCASNIHCWAPPSVFTVAAERMPKGYAPLRAYWTEKELHGWPAPEEVVSQLERWKLL